ncbi:MAG: hypothetical protein U9P72_02250 [Campylobacterota bacterium]|nr:hypothetical protein [Campylobacterota bacterium]
MYKRYVNAKKSSVTLDSVLAYIYRKQDLMSRCGSKGDEVVKGLIDLGLIRKVISKKGTFYFNTDKSKNFKAVDFAKEFLWAFHNSIDRQIQNNKRYILCFDKDIETGQGLVDIEVAIKNGYV